MNIIILGPTSFPFGFQAEIQRLKILTKNMVKVGLNVTVLNRYGTVHNNVSDDQHIKSFGDYCGVKYLFFSESPFRDKNFIKRNYSKIIGSLREIIYLFSQRKCTKILFVSSLSSYLLLYYILLSKLFNYKLVMQLVEFNSGQYRKKNIKVLLNDYLFEKIVFRKVDGIVPISNYLVKYLTEKGLHNKIVHIPLLSDLERFSSCTKSKEPIYFLYCASSWFVYEFTLVLEVFKKLNAENVKLCLVINGSNEFISGIKDKIEKLQLNGNVRIFNRLSDAELNKLYMNAYVLLVPLSDSIRDRARFPHKISEYICTGNPILTTNNGEVPFYFRDNDNAIIAETYDVEELYKKMHYALGHPEEVKRIGENALKMAKNEFDPIKYAINLREFFTTLITQ